MVRSTIEYDDSTVHSSPPFNPNRYKSQQQRHSGAFQQYDSDFSSESSDRSMHRGNSSGNGGRGPGRGGRNDRGGRGFSGGGFSRANPDRPLVQPTIPPEANTEINLNSNRSPPLAVSPSSRTSQQSTLVMTPSSQSYVSPQRIRSGGCDQNTSPSKSSQGSRSRRQMSSGQNYFNNAIVRGSQQHWAYCQEQKVRVINVPHGCWTNDIYKALAKYGTIVRIEIDPERACAWVTFQPPSNLDIYNQVIKIKKSSVKIENSSLRLFTVPSPVNPKTRYQDHNIFYANSIDFGVTIADNSMDVMQSIEASQEVQITLTLGDRKELDFQFPLIIDGELRKLRFRLPLSLVGVIHKVDNKETGQCALIVPFESSPQWFIQIKAGAIHKSCRSRDKTWIDWYSWYRQTDIVDLATRNRLSTIPVMNHHKDVPIIDIGRWTTYRVSFDFATLQGPKYNEFRDALADHGTPIQTLAEYDLHKGTIPIVWSLLEEEISGTHPHLHPSLTQESAFDELITGQVNLSFKVRYQLEACLSNGFLKEHTVTRGFLERLAAMIPDQAVYILEKVIDKQRTYFDPMEIFRIPLKSELKRKIPNYCVLSRSANFTPTMIHVGSPVIETSNRIVRKHEADADRFIRVKFSDEKTDPQIYSQDDDRMDAVFDRIKRAMNNGIVVAGRFYEFLAFGNSQFRENGAYFYAPTTSKSADDIRRSMGQFDHIKTAAKYGARLGQCFSTTRAIKTINVRIEKIDDIERNGYTFTDGVGKLSPLLAQMAAKELGLQNPFDDPPSLFQFRLGGCKGVLALDPTLTGSVVHIRPSQYKFEAQNVGLEIIRASSLAVACFNRQLIIILSTLGVKDWSFIQKQQEMVNFLERATKEEDVALDRLRRNIDFNQTTLTMAGMILDGFMKSRDPFMMSLLQLWRAYHIKYLKEKARIVIEDGAFVLGCVDETATLRGHYNNPQSLPSATREQKLATLPEIFLQTSDPAKKGHYKIIVGVCILARNPSLHAGDVRLVRAVDEPALHHLKNVVVLPQTGDRDIPNMCSGGDLDGDDYIVIWDCNFLPETINERPMDFTPPKPVDSDKPVTVKDITDFFVTYMKNDSLRQIATAHLAQADYNAEGVRDEKCLELAELHSQAVDYPKSGIPAIMDRTLKPRKWPHFQESKNRPAHKIYKSERILGMLYDQVQLVDFKPQYQQPFDDKILGAFELDKTMIEEAKDIKASYDASLRRLMAKHAIRTEFEAWSVFVLSHNLETRDYTFAEEFGRTVGILKAQFREICCEAAKAEGPSDFVRLAPFVAAMYTVTAREMEAALGECEQTKIVSGEIVPVRKMDPEDMPLMSFPWLFVNELGKIKNGSSLNRPSAFVHQGFAHKHTKKHGGTSVAPESGLGEIETTQGITHLGELLKLDFAATTRNNNLDSQQQATDQSADKKEVSQQPRDAAAESSAGESPPSLSRPSSSASNYNAYTKNANILPPPAASSSSLAPWRIAEPYNWKKDADRAAAQAKSSDGSVCSNPPSSRDRSSSTDSRRDEQQEVKVTIDLTNKKASALDRLSRFS